MIIRANGGRNIWPTQNFQKPFRVSFTRPFGVVASLVAGTLKIADETLGFGGIIGSR
jgi:hypothetical protein